MRREIRKDYDKEYNLISYTQAVRDLGMPEEDLVSFADVMDMQRRSQRKLLKHLLRLYQVVQQSDAVKDVIALPRFGNLEIINTEIDSLNLAGLQGKLDRVVAGLSRKSPSDPFAEAADEPQPKRRQMANQRT